MARPYMIPMAGVLDPAVRPSEGLRNYLLQSQRQMDLRVTECCGFYNWPPYTPDKQDMPSATH